MDASQVEGVIYDALGWVNAERPAATLIPLAPDTALFGPGSLLDSLDLIKVLTETEIGLSKAGFEISLADDDAVAEVPWSTVEALRDYILARLP
jgi:hypothetical protein